MQGWRGDIDALCGDMALKVFDWTQRADEHWRGSNSDAKRELLEAASFSRTLSDVSLCVEKRKPFDILAERPSFVSGRGDPRWRSHRDDLRVPKTVFAQGKTHPT